MTVTADKTSSVYARVPSTLVRELDLAAGIDGRSRSDAIRVAIGAYVAAVAQHEDEPGLGSRARRTQPEQEARGVEA